MIDIDALHARLRADPLTHLGRKSVRLIQPYEIGYEIARARKGHSVLPDPIEWEGFQKWVETRYGWTAEQGCRQNALGFAELLSVDECSAFDLFFELREAARTTVIGWLGQTPISVENVINGTRRFVQ